MSSGKPQSNLGRLRAAGAGAKSATFETGKLSAKMEAQRSPAHLSFLDTNILLYCDDSASPAKQQKALDIVLQHRRNGTGVVSLQVLQEYFANATRKLGLDPGLAREKVEVYARFRVAEPSVADLLAAIDLYRLQNLSFWDALILRSAKQSGCRVLLTEDMQHGQVIDGVRIVNPFL
jgi:predicted nucleic acid-binding protein